MIDITLGYLPDLLNPICSLALPYIKLWLSLSVIHNSIPQEILVRLIDGLQG